VALDAGRAGGEIGMPANLNKELDYYISHQREIVAEYNGKVVVIHGAKVVGAYDSELQATLEAKKKFRMGEFLVQRAEAGTDSYTQTFYSRASVG